MDWIEALWKIGWDFKALDLRHRRGFDVSNSGQMDIPTSAEKVLGGHLVQTLAKIDVL